MNVIDDDRKFRISKSGYSIKTGWATDSRIVAKYPGDVGDHAAFRVWMADAEHICDLHNDSLARVARWRGAYIATMLGAGVSLGDAHAAYDGGADSHDYGSDPVQAAQDEMSYWEESEATP